MKQSEQQMQQLKKHLNKQGITWRPTETWSLIFIGNHPEGIYISADKAPLPYLKKLTELTWEYRGHYTFIYVHPKQEVV